VVPTSLIELILVITFFLGSYSYFFVRPQRLVLSYKFLMMGGPAALMVFTLGLQVVDVQVAWLSWVLLVAAILWSAMGFHNLRASLAVANETARKETEQRKHQV
jgi:hypothetical protein